MPVSNIAVMNYSSTPDVVVQSWANATMKQMVDAARIWGIPVPIITVFPANANPTGNDSWIVVTDDVTNSPDRFGLGWHKTLNGQPVSYVLVEFTKGNGQTPSRVFSHEVLEMAVDPDITRLTPPIDGVQYWVEVGDVLSFDQGGYEIDGVLVSGFGTPAYFHLGPVGPDGFAFRGGKPDPVGGPLPAKAPSAIGTMVDAKQDDGRMISTFLSHPNGDNQIYTPPVWSRYWRYQADNYSPTTTA
jgi:hypothetical protein